MSPHFAYQRSAAAAWSRIDLLLTVYDVGLQCAQAALQAARSGDLEAMTRQRLRFYRVLLQILDGLDGEHVTSRNIQRLALYLFDRSNDGGEDDWLSIVRVLQTLRDGYAAIREEAVQLEEQGVIPPVDCVAAVNLSA